MLRSVGKHRVPQILPRILYLRMMLAVDTDRHLRPQPNRRFEGVRPEAHERRIPRAPVYAALPFILTRLETRACG